MGTIKVKANRQHFIPELEQVDIVTNNIRFQRVVAIEQRENGFVAHDISRLRHFEKSNFDLASQILCPNSLDFFLWGDIKPEVYINKPQTVEELKEEIRTKIADVDQ